MGAIGEIKLMFFFQIMDHLTEILMPFGFEKPDVTDNTDEILDLLKKFSSKLRQLDASCLESSMFSESDALTLVIASSSVTLEDVRDVIRIPDLVANASSGETDLSPWRNRIVKAANFARHLLAENLVSQEVVAELLLGISTQFWHISEVLDQLYEHCVEFPYENSDANPGEIILSLPERKQEKVISVIAEKADSAKSLSKILAKL